MSKVISISNQKGGTANTATCVSLGAALAREGKKVMAIDLNPQADLTACLGVRNPDDLDITISTLMLKAINEERFDWKEGIIHTKEGISLVPSNLDLSGVEMNLVGTMNREQALRQYVDKVKNNFDFVLIDCPPTLGMLTINALSAADSVIIPVQAHYLPAKGMKELLKTISKVQRYVNPNLRIDGVLMTLVDNRTNFAKEVTETIRNDYGSHIKIFDANVPIRVKAAETTAMGVSIFEYEPKSDVAKAYADLAKEVMKDGQREKTCNITGQCR